MTYVDRETRCILAWMVSYKRSGYQFQEMLANSLQGHAYFSDDYQGYKTVLYSPAIHYPMKDKSEKLCRFSPLSCTFTKTLSLLFAQERSFAQCSQALCLCLQSATIVQAPFSFLQPSFDELRYSMILTTPKKFECGELRRYEIIE